MSPDKRGTGIVKEEERVSERAGATECERFQDISSFRLEGISQIWWGGGDEEVGSDSQVGPDFSLTPSQLAYRLQVTWFPMQKASRIDTGLPPSYFGTAAIIQLKL